MEVEHSKFYYSQYPQEGERPASYGMTHKQLIELQEKQSRSIHPMVCCSEDPEIQIQESEAKFCWMVAVENPLFDERTGERRDNGVQFKIFNIPVWKQMMKYDYSPGQLVTVVHNPFKYIEKLNQEQIAKDKSDKGKLK